jgi:signal transduction histidine kinase/ligand-binding sensor domain-containing protein
LWTNADGIVGTLRLLWLQQRGTICRLLKMSAIQIRIFLEIDMMKTKTAITELTEMKPKLWGNRRTIVSAFAAFTAVCIAVFFIAVRVASLALAFGALALTVTGSPLAQSSTTQSAQPSSVQRVGMEQGLSSRSLTSGLQDRYGFLWFGTQYGLNRWDGVTMTIFTALEGDSTSLPDNAINHIHEDKRGRLWVATNAGLARFNRNANTFTRFLADKPIADIFEDSQGTLWLWVRALGTASDEVCAFSPTSGSVTSFSPTSSASSGLRSAYIYSFFEDKHNTVWLGTANGLYRYHRQAAKFVGYGVDASAGALARSPRSHVQSIAEGGGMLWIGTDGGLGRIPSGAQPEQAEIQWQEQQQGQQHGQQQRASPTPDVIIPAGGIILLQSDAQGRIWGAAMQAGSVANQVRFFIVDAAQQHADKPRTSEALPVVPLGGKSQQHRCAAQRDALWWGVGNGVVRLNTHTGAAELLLSDPTLATRLNAPVVGVVIDGTSDKISDKTSHNADAVWFLRASLGVETLTQAVMPFRHIPFTEGASTASSAALLSPRVSAIRQTSDGAVWVGYKEGAGVSKYEPSKGAFVHFKQDPNNATSISGFGGETSIRALCEDKSGVLWVASSALDKFNAATNNFTHYPLSATKAVAVTDVVETRTGELWVGSKAGLYVMDRAQDRVQAVFKAFTHNPSNEASVGNNLIHTLYEDRAGKLWIGHEGGLDCYDAATKQFQHFRSQMISQSSSQPPSQLASASSSLAAGSVTCLYEDSKGRFWVGTRGGLHQFDRTSGTVTARYTHREGRPGLPDNAIAAILEDGKGNLWISTRRGLVRFTPEAQAFRVFGASDGVRESEFLDRAAVRLRDGQMWFGSSNGIIAFHPDSVPHSAQTPRVVLTGIKKFGNATPLATYLADMESIEFGHEDTVISFEYVALNFLKGAQNQYAYKLEGFDAEWQYVGSLREAKYTNLPAGTYKFLVKASNSDGVWSEHRTGITVVIRPAWWATWWFIALVAVAAGAAVWAGMKWRVRSVEHRNQVLERLVEERTHALQEANQEVTRQMEILNEQAKDIEIANARLQETNLDLDRTLTELKQTQSQLVQSERINATGMLTAGVMHEINNPNASLASALELSQQNLDTVREYFLSLLDENDRQTPEAMRFTEMVKAVKDMIAVALNGSERIKRIVTALQGFTKHQHDGAAFNRVADEVHSTVVMFQYQFKTVEVEENVSPDLKLQGSWAELNQALLNLMVNAAQAGATRICVEAHEEVHEAQGTGNIVLRVSDNGDGMSEEIQQRIFEPFYTTKSIGNSGLGLSISKKIVEKHNGTITVESALGKGTTFSIKLAKNALVEL